MLRVEEFYKFGGFENLCVWLKFCFFVPHCSKIFCSRFAGLGVVVLRVHGLRFYSLLFLGVAAYECGATARRLMFYLWRIRWLSK